MGEGANSFYSKNVVYKQGGTKSLGRPKLRWDFEINLKKRKACVASEVFDST
jgi:hypothetical protein